MRGIELFEDGCPEEALPYLREDARCESPPGLATLYLGSLESIRTGDVAHIDRAVSLVRGNLPEDLIVQVSGATRYGMGMTEPGLQLMRQSVALNPSRQNIWVFVTRLDNHDEHAQEALKFYNILLERDSSDTQAIIGKGSVLSGLGDLEGARACFKEALFLSPEDATAHYELGNVLASAPYSDYERALNEFTAAIDLGYWRPHCAWAGAGYCHHKLGRQSEAIHCAERSLQIEPNYEYAQELLKDARKSQERGETGE